MNLEEITFCGLFCGLCASRRRIPRQAEMLRKTLQKEGYDVGYFDIPTLQKVFAQFWEGLNILADTSCPGCRAGGGNPGCAIRQCAQERIITVCPLCPDFPCERLQLLRNYPMLLADGRRLQEIGLERWVTEKEARAATGFAYTDVRFPD
jgi:hypothetical protein